MMEKIKSDTKTKLLTVFTVSIPVVILWIDFYTATNKSLAIFFFCYVLFLKEFLYKR